MTPVSSQGGAGSSKDKKKLLRRGLLIGGVLFVICLVVLLSIATRLTPIVRDRVVTALNEHFDSDVELQSLQVSIFPRPEVTGGSLVLRYKGRKDVPPLISIKTFTAGASLLGLIGAPLHLSNIELDGLEIRVPRGGLDGKKEGGTVTGTDKNSSTLVADVSRAPSQATSRATQPELEPSPIVIDEIVSRAARVEIASNDPAKSPRVFEIHDLTMTGFAFDRAAAFHASLTNPKPEGQIGTSGNFGPWHTEEPRKTPLEGEYVFRHANLDTIKGIGGVLASTGQFGGVLERIAVQGSTDTPDFRVDVAGQPVHLQTRFKAVVDGMNGNTWLDPVDATLLDSTIHARGAVVRTKDVKGRAVSLDIAIAEAHIEDVLKLAIKSATPPLTGNMALTAKFLLPPGEQDVAQRLRLDGRFKLAQARFTSLNVQKKIDILSRRGRGDTDDSDGASVVSDLNGRFKLKSGTLSFSELTFGVPGAKVQVAGSYTLQSEALDFAGHVLLDAKLAEMTTGVKAVIARVAQPLFRRPGGGSKLPIKISGTRSKPSFGLDVKKALTPGQH